jgi:hypothetical protein
VILGTAVALRAWSKAYTFRYSLRTLFAMIGACATYLSIATIEFKENGYSWEHCRLVIVEEICRFVVFLFIGISWYATASIMTSLLSTRSSRVGPKGKESC